MALGVAVGTRIWSARGRESPWRVGDAAFVAGGLPDTSVLYLQTLAGGLAGSYEHRPGLHCATHCDSMDAGIARLGALVMPDIADLPVSSRWPVGRVGEPCLGGSFQHRWVSMKYRPYGSLGFEVSALGFGCMRLPVVGGDASVIDRPLAVRMLQTAIDRGVNYIDTAYPYHGGNSEGVIGEALRHGYRDRVRVATKLPIWMVTCPADVDRLLHEQLRRLGDEYIDVYLVHNLARSTWPLVARHQVLERLEKARQAGKIGHLGFSYHDSFELFKTIVDSHDGWQVAQLQYNYANETVQAGTRGLEYGAAKGLAMVIMEPLLGGCLATPPPKVAAVFEQATPTRSPAEWALQWLWHKPEVAVVLSGMSTMAQVEQNLASADRSGIGHLTAADLEVLRAAFREYAGSVPIPCTKCRYCMPCPHGVDIPVAFDLYNGVKAFGGTQGLLNRIIYQGHLVENHGGLCVACGTCMKKCPQKIDIISWLRNVHEEMMKKPAAGH